MERIENAVPARPPGGFWTRILVRFGRLHAGCGGRMIRTERTFGPANVCTRCGQVEYRLTASGEG